MTHDFRSVPDQYSPSQVPKELLDRMDAEAAAANEQPAAEQKPRRRQVLADAERYAQPVRLARDPDALVHTARLCAGNPDFAIGLLAEADAILRRREYDAAAEQERQQRGLSEFMSIARNTR